MITSLVLAWSEQITVYTAVNTCIHRPLLDPCSAPLHPHWTPWILMCKLNISLGLKQISCTQMLRHSGHSGPVCSQLQRRCGWYIRSILCTHACLTSLQGEQRRCAEHRWCWRHRCAASSACLMPCWTFTVTWKVAPTANHATTAWKWPCCTAWLAAICLHLLKYRHNCYWM